MNANRRFVRMSDVKLERSECPDWISADLGDLNVRFREIAPHCREYSSNLVGEGARYLLHQHPAAKSAVQTFQQVATNDCNADKAAFRVDVVNHSKQTQSGR
ncbi:MULTISPECIES: hypothetical protein [unclassified Ruegeria]|uniref:hypothetical protein n=1 Tax=unclassified Ruegeria TaxID=2625375 RepID=UPI00149215FD|nr:MULTISPECIES: hypothetical protein [unclassified Ruegeria]NOD49853.1 hypothetical protein [Ruegeria sp. HKCCD5849]NOD54176.1 hypothetical protein [Ruegeria sp. HKCCD5851]NOD70226.1 hypothetical protein [Ruegeria sp. HKCCD7303]